MPTLLLAQAKFQIRISVENQTFEELRREIYFSALRGLGYRVSDNIDRLFFSPFESLVRSRLKRAERKDDVFVFLSDYEEREGSFIAMFTVFVLGAVTNYGSLRESMDYIRKDFRYFFSDILRFNADVDVSYTDIRNDGSTEKLRPVFDAQIGEMQIQSRRLFSIVGALGFIAILLAIYAVYRVENSDQILTKSEVQEVMHQELHEFESRKDKEEVLLVYPERRVDTARAKP